MQCQRTTVQQREQRSKAVKGTSTELAASDIEPADSVEVLLTLCRASVKANVYLGKSCASETGIRSDVRSLGVTV